jgi:primosomal protein N' (replication factor Y)
MGMVVRLHPPEPGGPPTASLKSLLGPVDAAPALGPRDLALARWMADRTFCSLGEALFTVCSLGKRPPPKRPKDTPVRGGVPPAAFHLTDDQTRAVDRLTTAHRAGSGGVFLLQGVAASGKTEVYRRLISAVLADGRGAILLVPEIGLTPQMEDRLRGWFGDALDLWHSEMSDGERARVWERVRAGRARVVVGPRSALFLPVEPLGAIIVDEEHDPSFKQDSAPHYHARDAAREKARLHGAVLVLGSATPSLETREAARRGELERIVLEQRVDNRPFPMVRPIDTRGEGWYLSDALVAALRERLERKEQSLLFLNRRGYATHVACRACGWEAACPHCAIPLVHHRAGEPPLRCHTCGHGQGLAAACPSCGDAVLRLGGRGTQRVVADLATLFPSARLLRWDADAMAARGAHAEAYRRVRDGEVDIIVGTQMIAQGHDFPNLTLVGVVDADRALLLPDFRAAERTFQQLMQVAGRAGRADRPGEVLIQTRRPDHYALAAAAARDPEAFVEAERGYRLENRYPPFTRVAQAVVRARREEAAQAAADALAAHLEKDGGFPGAEILGPAPAFHRQKAGWHQWQVVVKAPVDVFESVVGRLTTFSPPAGVTWAVDVDPEGLT